MMFAITELKRTSHPAVLGGLAICLLGLGTMVFRGGTASAHSSAVQSACKTDYYKFCPAYKIGTPQLKACMRSAGGNLSRRCIDALANAGEIPRKYHSSNLRK